MEKLILSSHGCTYIVLGISVVVTCFAVALVTTMAVGRGLRAGAWLTGLTATSPAIEQGCGLVLYKLDRSMPLLGIHCPNCACYGVSVVLESILVLRRTEV